MSWSLRRAVLTLGPVTLWCLAAFFLASTGMARPPVQLKQPPGGKPVPPQPGLPVQPEKDPTEFSQAIDLPRNPDVGRQIEAAQDYIKDEDWVTATKILQSLLSKDENYFTTVIRTGPDGKQVKSFVSVKAEANRLIATLPEKGMEFYKLNYGPKADELLKEAKATSDVEKLKLVTRYYLHTDAGAEATNLLATYMLDRGEYTAAALCYQKLLSRAGADKLSSTTLFRAWFAFQNSGDKANAATCRAKLNAIQTLPRFGDQTKTLEELADYIAKNGRAQNDFATYDTPMIGAVPHRNSQGIGSVPFLEQNWRQHLARTTETENLLKNAEASLKDRLGQAIIPGMQPITATVMYQDQKLSLVVFRSNWGIHAVDMKTGKLRWETPSALSLDKMFHNNKMSSHIASWGGVHLQTRPSLLLENSTVGTLSSDGAYVYMVEDLEVPPANQYNPQFGNVQPQQNFGDKTLTDAVNSSKLMAFDLATGKLKWEIGGVPANKDDKIELAESYFLGSPLPLGGKLYVLTEKSQDLRLACLDPLTGKLLGVQVLATTRDKMSADVWRRVQATHLAYGEGILVCPTNSGAMLGVDLLSNSLVWAYPYRDKDGSEAAPVAPGRGRGLPPGMQFGPDGQPIYANDTTTHWKVTPPVIVDGKVVFTAPDATAIHCINLRDGGAVWQTKRALDDLYLGGVYNGKAVIVGKNYVRALSLAKGDEVWRVTTGVPSGYGVASENIYYVPLREAGLNKEPAIYSIDIEKGLVIARTKSRKKEMVPGNLLFYEGDMLSQGVTEMASFPQVTVQLAKIDAALTANPNDPVGLYKRGQLRLDKGDLAGAIADLRNSLNNKPENDLKAQAREKLYDSFTEYFQRDFTKAEEYLKEYEELCNIPIGPSDVESVKLQKQADQRRRRANFLCLVAKGKEAQGKLVDAFQRYQEFAAEAAKPSTDGKPDELISVVDEPNVKATPEVWSGGRIAAMVAKATPENRKPLEELMTKRWNELKKTEDIGDIRNFVRVFGSLFTVGREARLELANRLMEDNSPLALLEAEQQLSLLRVRGEDPALSGRAVEALARLNTRKGLLEDASYYYRILRDEYAKVPVRDGKTGADLFNDMATDKRLLPHLDVPGNISVTGKNIKVEESRGNYPYNQQVYEFAQAGEKLPFFQKHSISLRFDYHQLKITDKTKPTDEKSKNLPRTNFQNLVFSGQANFPQFKYMTVGHLVVLPIGHLVFGIDPIRGEVLWERNLYGDRPSTLPGVSPLNMGYNQLTVDPRDNSVVVVWQDGWVQRLGGAGTLESSVLVLLTRDGLVAIDPVTNKTLWTRGGINTRSQVFNDDQYVYVVEEGNDGVAASTHVMRAYDGVTVNVPDFAALYQKRVRQVGRNLLLSETDAKGQMTYRLHDVLTGKDLWSTSFAANSKVLQSENVDFGGVVEPDGSVRVVDIRNGKEALKTKMDPKFLDKVTSVHLLFDGHYFFVACTGPTDPALNPWGGVMTNLMPGTGMRALPVNGEFYCFDAQTGKTKWHSPLLNEMIVLDHFADIPVVLATSRYNRWMNGPGGARQVQQVVQFEAIVKTSGKYVFKGENQQWQQFHAMNLDPKKGTIELVNYNTKLTVTATNDPLPDKKSTEPKPEPKPVPVPERKK